jgi:MFS family permease
MLYTGYMTRSRLFRLRPALGLAAAMMAVWGLVYSFPVFVVPLAAELHADRAAIAGIVVATLAWGAVAGPPLGALVDRVGPRTAVVGGIGLAVIGFAAFSRVTELWQAYVAFAGILGTGQTLIYLGSTVLIARTFSGERATAFGITYAGLGIGTGLYAIGGQLMVVEFGWRTAALLLGMTPLLVVPGILRLQERVVARVELPPPGAPSRHPAVGGATLGALALILFASASLGLLDEGVYQNLLPHAVLVGFSPTVAAAALALVSVAYVLGQLVGGAATDRWGARPTALAAFAVAAVGAVGIVTARAGDPLAEVRLVASALLSGAGLAVLLLVRLATFADRFAGPRFGFLSGIFALAYPVGGSFVVWFGGLSYDLWRSYLPAFAVSAAGLLLATTALLLVTRRRAAEPADAPGALEVAPARTTG